jgi:D-beta-D-heptose 7-phosphate kinase/D-beta-D-heptose 1-phosphate adenosyltransferase
MKLAESATAILLSDYRKGVLTGALMAECAAVARKRGIPITGNLKPEALGEFGSLTVVTLNLLEASQASGLRHLHERSEFQAAGEMLLTKTGAEHVLITQGSEGLTLFHRADKANPTHIPAHPVEVYDVAGAGDTVISTLTLALAASASMAEAAMLANVAAAEAVKKVGVATVSTQEILSGMRAAK